MMLPMKKLKGQISTNNLTDEEDNLMELMTTQLKSF